MAEVDAYPWVGIFDDLSPEDRLSVAQLVVDGGAVEGDVGQLAGRLKNARMLALLREQATDRIVGVASLKSPDPGYRLNKFDDAGVAITGYEAAPELGYVVVAKDMRGKQLSGRLVDTFEITRFCLDRRLSARERRQVRDTLVSALVDHALATGITAYSAIAEMGWFQQIFAFGWHCMPLGLPQVIDGTMLAALRIEITPETPNLLEAGRATAAALRVDRRVAA